MKRIRILSLFVILLTLGIFKLTRFPHNYVCSDCNIIIISIETLRADHLPCYGYQKNTAPNICEFANTSVLFEKHYTQSPYTLPAHASLFTSLYPSQHNLNIIAKDKLSDQIITLAQVLKANNYSTFWSAPFNDPHLPKDDGLGKGFVFFNQETRDEPIIGWKNTLNNATKHEKFFAFLHSFKIHEPYFPINQNLISNFAKKTNGEIPTNWSQIWPGYKNNLINNLPELISLLDEDARNQSSNLLDSPQSIEDETLQKVFLEGQARKESSPELKSKLNSIFRST